MTQQHVWDLPGWKGAVTIAQLLYGTGASFEDSWGWFWPDGPSCTDTYIGADPWGWLWVRADTPLRRIAVPKSVRGGGSEACVWLADMRELALYLPTHKHAAVGVVPGRANEVGWLRVAEVHAQPPQRAVQGV